MGIIEILTRAQQESGNKFLVIGGYAVNAHGYPRATADLDILVRKDQMDFWKGIVLKNNYGLVQERDAFMQFTPLDPGLIPIDLMLVNEQTFARLQAEAVSGVLGGTPVQHPSLFHLIALKLHVIKQELPHRHLRDFNDVLELVRINKVDTGSGEFRQLCERYGTTKLYEAIVRGSR